MIPRVRFIRRTSVEVVSTAVTDARCNGRGGMRDCPLGDYGRTRMSGTELSADTDIGEGKRSGRHAPLHPVRV
jgi:hypothetical protein